MGAFCASTAPAASTGCLPPFAILVDEACHRSGEGSSPASNNLRFRKRKSPDLVQPHQVPTYRIFRLTPGGGYTILFPFPSEKAASIRQPPLVSGGPKMRCSLAMPRPSAIIFIAVIAMIGVGCSGGKSGEAPTAPSTSRDIIFQFTGVTYSGSMVPSGTRFSGSYKFKSSAVDSDTDPGVGLYLMQAPYGLTLTVGQLTFTRYDGLRIRVRNDIAGLEDDYDVQLDPQLPNAIRLFWRTRTLTAFLNDALPLTPPDQNVFGGVLEVNNPGGSTAIGGTIDTLTLVN